MVGCSCGLVEEVREEMGGSYKGHGSGVKASFDHIYDLEDPRGYFNTLDELGYQAPEHGSRIFNVLLEKKEFNGPRAKVVDLCCSYGVNAALLKHDLSLGDLYSHYGSEQLADLSANELAAADGTFSRTIACNRRPRSLEWTPPKTPSPTLFGPGCSTRASPRTWRKKNRRTR
jgi:hypothetical protein